MGVLLKQGVIGPVHREIRRAIGRVAKYYAEVFEEDLVITSMQDSVHSDGSLHFDGKAFDFRNPVNMRGHKQSGIIVELRGRLGGGYDILPYDWGFHIEWDPK